MGMFAQPLPCQSLQITRQTQPMIAKCSGNKNADGTTTASGTSPSAMYQNTPHLGTTQNSQRIMDMLSVATQQFQRVQRIMDMLSVATQQFQGVLGITMTPHLRTQNSQRVLPATTTDIDA